MRKILVECKPDQVLINILFDFEKKIIEHKQDKFRVINILIRKEMDSLGVIDEDPQASAPLILKEIRKNKPVFDKYNLKIYSLENKNKLLEISPRLEDWVIFISKNQSLDITKYNLPSNPNNLHEIINLNLDKFEKFLIDLKASIKDLITEVKNTLNQ